MTPTTHLPTTTPQSLHRATTHPFLRLSGQGKISKPVLSQWLSQDRLYAQSYIRFIGLLLSKIEIPHTPSPQNSPPISTRTANTLITALVNIREELAIFETTAEKYGLALTPTFPSAEDRKDLVGPNTTTAAYINLFMAAGSPAVSLLEGMVVLWATETCYLRAWRYAAGFLDENTGAEDADGGALRKAFIPNWASKEFEGFVDSIGEVVDVLGEGVDTDVMRKCEDWWRQVVWLEERFWPDLS